MSLGVFFAAQVNLRGTAEAALTRPLSVERLGSVLRPFLPFPGEAVLQISVV